jgi:hypothetical protein
MACSSGGCPGVVTQSLLELILAPLATGNAVPVFLAGACRTRQCLKPEPVTTLGDRVRHVLGPELTAQPAAVLDRACCVAGEDACKTPGVLAFLDQAPEPLLGQGDRLADAVGPAVLAIDVPAMASGETGLCAITSSPSEREKGPHKRNAPAGHGTTGPRGLNTGQLALRSDHVTRPDIVFRKPALTIRAPSTGIQISQSPVASDMTLATTTTATAIAPKDPQPRIRTSSLSVDNRAAIAAQGIWLHARADHQDGARRTALALLGSPISLASKTGTLGTLESTGDALRLMGKQ